MCCRGGIVVMDVIWRQLCVSMIVTRGAVGALVWKV